MSQKERMYSIPETPGFERGCVLIAIPTPSGQITYRGHRWGTADKHWLIELVDGNQVEIHNQPTILIHIPKPGYTFELDGTCHELQSTSGLVVN